MKIAVVGTGYVGLVSAACFAEFGASVVGVDSNTDKIARLLNGEIPIYEPGLDDLVARNRAAGRLTFTSDLKSAVDGAEAVFIAVGTPSRRGDGHADLGYVYAAAEQIADALTGYAVIVDKSTVPVGTSRAVESVIRKRRPDAEFDVCSNPEFLREGSAIEDFMHPDRIVIGVTSKRAEEVMRRLYAPLSAVETPILFTGRETAELIKYAANGFLAMKITFINEISDLCEKVGADVQDVARGIGMDSRIGKKFLQAGPGYGGSCFPKDTLALAKTAQDFESPIHLIESTIAVNHARKQSMAARVQEAVGGSLDGKKIAVLGVAFKADTDDMRESPAIDIVAAMQAQGARVYAYDPVAMTEAQKVMDGVTWGQTAYEVCADADAVVIITEWNEFRALNLSRLRDIMAQPVMVDLRNLYNPQQVVEAGFAYSSIGRPPSAPKDVMAKTKLLESI